MYLWTSVPSLCYSILFYFLVQESPRWLLVRGRKQDAIETLQQIASLNGNSITSSFSMLHACTMNNDTATLLGVLVHVLDIVHVPLPLG